MTTTPNPTPKPAPTPAPSTTAAADRIPARVAADQLLTERCQSSGEHLAGILAAGMLDAVATPAKLPELLFPDIDPWVVRQIWDAALPVGYRAGLLAARPRWTPEALDRLRTQLSGAGYEAMARQVTRTRNIHPPTRHPADTDTHTTRGGDR